MADLAHAVPTEVNGTEAKPSAPALQTPTSQSSPINSSSTTSNTSSPTSSTPPKINAPTTTGARANLSPKITALLGSFPLADQSVPQSSKYYLDVVKEGVQLKPIDLSTKVFHVVGLWQLPLCRIPSADIKLDHESISREHAVFVHHTSGDLVQFGGSTRLYLVQTHNVALKAQSDALAEAPKPGLSAADAIRMQKQRITAATQGAVASGQARQPAAAGEAAAKSAAPRMAKPTQSAEQRARARAVRRAHLIALGMSPDEADAALARADEEEEEEADEGEGQRRAWHQRGRSGDDEDEGGGSGSDKEKEKKGSISGGGDSLAARIGGLAKRLNEEAAAGGGEGGRRGTKQQKGRRRERREGAALTEEDLDRAASEESSSDLDEFDRRAEAEMEACSAPHEGAPADESTSALRRSRAFAEQATMGTADEEDEYLDRKPTRRRAGAQRVAGVAPMQTHTTVKAELDALRAERATLQGKIDALARYQGLLDRAVSKRDVIDAGDSLESFMSGVTTQIEGEQLRNLRTRLAALEAEIQRVGRLEERLRPALAPLSIPTPTPTTEPAAPTEATSTAPPPSPPPTAAVAAVSALENVMRARAMAARRAFLEARVAAAAAAPAAPSSATAPSESEESEEPTPSPQALSMKDATVVGISAASAADGRLVGDTGPAQREPAPLPTATSTEQVLRTRKAALAARLAEAARGGAIAAGSFSSAAPTILPAPPSSAPRTHVEPRVAMEKEGVHADETGVTAPKEKEPERATAEAAMAAGRAATSGQGEPTTQQVPPKPGSDTSDSDMQEFDQAMAALVAMPTAATAPQTTPTSAPPPSTTTPPTSSPVPPPSPPEGTPAPPSAIAGSPAPATVGTTAPPPGPPPEPQKGAPKRAPGPPRVMGPTLPAYLAARIRRLAEEEAEEGDEGAAVGGARADENGAGGDSDEEDGELARLRRLRAGRGGAAGAAAAARAAAKRARAEAKAEAQKRARARDEGEGEGEEAAGSTAGGEDTAFPVREEPQAGFSGPVISLSPDDIDAMAAAGQEGSAASSKLARALLAGAPTGRRARRAAAAAAAQQKVAPPASSSGDRGLRALATFGDKEDVRDRRRRDKEAQEAAGARKHGLGTTGSEERDARAAAEGAVTAREAANAGTAAAEEEEGPDLLATKLPSFLKDRAGLRQQLLAKEEHARLRSEGRLYATESVLGRSATAAAAPTSAGTSATAAGSSSPPAPTAVPLTDEKRRRELERERQERLRRREDPNDHEDDEGGAGGESAPAVEPPSGESDKLAKLRKKLGY